MAESESDSPNLSRSEEAADWLAQPMFYLSLVFLVLLAGLVVAWVDVLPDPIDESAIESVEAVEFALADFWQHPALQTGYVILGLLLAIWPLFLVELVYVRWLSFKDEAKFKNRWIRDLICVACPPLRMGKAIPAKRDEIWLPRFDWHPAGKPLHRGLERVFSKPMLIIALLILPVLLIEFRYKELLQENIWLKLVLSISMGLIWCAFACEFILMVCSTTKKLDYVKRNWIDLAIILLPLVSFLRSLRVFRAAKLAKFAKLQQLTKMGRVYRMRGLLAKTIRAFLVLEIVSRILKTAPEKRLDKLMAQVEDKEEELRELKQRIENIRAEMEAEELAEENTSNKLPEQNDTEERNETAASGSSRKA